MTKTLGFTGSRSFTIGDMPMVQQFDDWFKTFDRFVTGGAKGFDAMVGFYLARKFPKKSHHIIVPANKTQIYAWWNHDFDDRDRNEWDLTWEHMHPTTSYKARNQAIVDASDELFFGVSYDEDDQHSVRSGSWQTIRLALGAGLPISGVVLDSKSIFV